MSTPAVPSPTPSLGSGPAHLHLDRFHASPIVRRVRDTPGRRFAKLICAVFLSFLFAAAFLLFFLFLILRPHRPRFHVASFSVNLQNPASPSTSFNGSFRNPNREIGFYYDSMSGSVYYRNEQVAVFDRLLMPFYQPPKNTTVVLGRAAGGKADGVVLEQIEADAAAGRVGFRLELRTMVRFRVTIWDTHRHRMHVSCELEVGADGNLLPEFKDKRCPIYFL